METITKQFIIAFIKNLVSSVKGVQFAFITYRTKENFYRTEETSIFKLNIGASVTNLYKADIETLENLTVRQIKNNSKFTKFTESEILFAKNELLQSLNESVAVGVGNNSKYTKQGYFKHINKNIKYTVDENNEPQQLYINALVESKEVLIEATVKKVKNSKTKSIIKSLLSYNYLKRSKIRVLRIDLNQIKVLNINKNKLLIDATI